VLVTYEVLEKAVKQYSEEIQDERNEDELQQIEDTQLGEIIELPLKEKYFLLLKDLRFDYASFKDTQGKYRHHYSTYLTGNYSPPLTKINRLAQELADMSSSLPCEHTNSIFVRSDSDRIDVMRALVMGANGTPYAHGAFLYDIHFDDTYPNAPPKVNLSTTGSGKVRFNPNLYSCGKVCLSLLGTWRGNATENWDPKLSTLLQVLVSLQSIIMSEEVYFNEPGFEGKAGTEDGKKFNEAYSNIVRYCNIKYAMIDQIRSPPKGFEVVVKRHFFLKKAEILEEVQTWVKAAQTRDANYTELVSDHNSTWCNEFKKDSKQYLKMLTEAVGELEKELNKLAPPTIKELGSSKILHSTMQKPHSSGVKKRQIQITEGVQKLEDIDVSYEAFQGSQTKELNINDESVKDRWSRYIGAMGIDAVAKQSVCSIFLIGLGSLGIEIAKNIAMAGVKRLTIHEQKKSVVQDLAGQFYVAEEQLGMNRAQASLNKIQQLNYYVKVDLCVLNSALPLTDKLIDEQLGLK